MPRRPFDPVRYSKDLESAWNLKNPDLFVPHHAENVELQDPMAPGVRRGKDAVRERLRAWSEAFSELDVRLLQSVVQDRNVALLYECTGRHTGELEIGPGERIPPTNKRAAIQFAEFITLGAEGKIVKATLMLDSGKLLQQLGVLPAPGSPQQPPAWERNALQR